MFEHLKLFEFFATKICHDLSGVAGVINNGTNVLSEEYSEKNIISNEFLELVEEGSDSLISKIIFLRQCFGSFDTISSIEASELVKTIKNYLKTKEIDLEIEEESLQLKYSQEQKFILGKLLLQMVSVASDSLLSGGKIIVSSKLTKDNKLYVKVIAEGSRVKLSLDISSILEGKEESEVTVQNICAYLLVSYVKKNNLISNFQAEDAFFEVNVQQK